MSEYTPSEDDERIAHAYAKLVYLGSGGMASQDEAVGEFYAYLAAHDARVRRDAYDEGYEDGQHDAHEHRPGRKSIHPYRQEQTNE